MKRIGDFLTRFQNLTPPDDAVKKAVVDVVADELGVSIAKKDVYIKQNVAHVKTTSIIKNTLALNRGRILSALYTKLPKLKDTIRDVR